ncbi:beta-lactamase domain protein [Pseudogulbenkiania sp. NH8B]|uniref:MBL fold metallo-hydrolase n=1 Tax=Pseudogulbenkiania sp. (strain NH8B) TaxID=748280 RepID=UPI000227A2BF|nr:MBL fold metallo-hydrolase [Pseudogulbenkiania sp. NH8B]BAK78633.1 beta-lactamase domain protein [Pseudogulbenkiania sp. NH8B]
MSAQIEAFYDPATHTISYVVYDQPGGHAAIIDPVLDYDAKAGRTGTVSAGRIREFVTAHRLRVDWILETHAHADHLSAAALLRDTLGGRIAIGAGIPAVQRIFKGIFHLGEEFRTDGSQFDVLLHDDERFMIGTLEARALAVPGHTPADIAYQIGDAVFVGDTLFMPDVGSARCDFPGGDAATLYRSVRRLLDLPGETRLFMCHDYPPEGRAPRWETTVAEQRAHNIHLHDGIGEADFVAMREARDATLEMPLLILPSVQVNIRAGQLPPAESDGYAYLKIPLNRL